MKNQDLEYLKIRLQDLVFGLIASLNPLIHRVNSGDEQGISDLVKVVETLENLLQSLPNSNSFLEMSDGKYIRQEKANL